MEMLEPKAVWEAVATLDLHPLEGGALELPLLRLADLYRVAWMASNADAHPALRLVPAPELDWSEVEAHASPLPDGVVVGHEESGTRFAALQDLDDLAALLAQLPDGVELELITAGRRVGSAQRYLGRVEKGVFLVQHTYPALTLATLERAVELGKQERVTLETAEQAQLAARLANQELEGTFYEATAEGLMATCGIQGQPEDLTGLELVRPFALQALFPDGPWDYTPAEKTEEELELEASLQSLQDKLSQALTAPDPPGQELILDGDYGRFFRADLTSLPHVVEEDKTLLDEEMKQCGFHPLGDLSCTRLSRAVMRGYEGHDGCFAGLTSLHWG